MLFRAVTRTTTTTTAATATARRSVSVSFHTTSLVRHAAAAAPPPPPPSADAAAVKRTKSNIETTEQDVANLAAAPMSDDDERFVGMSGAEIVMDLLRAHNVKQVFGYPGGAILPVFDAIYDETLKDDSFNFVLPRHEQGETKKKCRSVE